MLAEIRNRITFSFLFFFFFYLQIIVKTEDLTRLVISYETSFRRVSSILHEMATRVRFLISYHYFKGNFIAHFNRKYNVCTDGIMKLRISEEVLSNVWSCDFLT